jgi:hypothetical protein
LKDFFHVHGEGLPSGGIYERVIREIERPLFEQTLIACRWNQKRAAEVLGINRNTLRKRLQELGISPPNIDNSLEDSPLSNAALPNPIEVVLIDSSS